MMKKMELSKTREFDPRTMKKFLLHDSPWFRILNFNLPAGHTSRCTRTTPRGS